MAPVRRQSKDDEKPAAADVNPVTDGDGNLPEQTDPSAGPTTTPTDPETAQAVADATELDKAENAPDESGPTDVAAGSDGGPKIEGPTADATGVDVGSPELDERDHSKGCPAQRLEAYPQTSPDGTIVKVSHCIDCGGTTVNGPIDD